MGNNLSSTFRPDTSKDILSPTDARADMILGLLWLGAIYAMAMIWSTLALVDRWKGPTDKIRVGGSRVVAAMALSMAWPAVVVYLMTADR
ncbi:hypothetical protein PT974_08108 [Cladobotryum mycophilum]|uniref:Uncharacterized protein n=1 Tax=Cladobotryum mycophilum TaxID=491253 RepID=A0ABR0SCG8_9HYPO